MRLVLVPTFALAFALGLGACESGPDFASVQAEDSIEAYEAFLAADPDTFYKPQIDVRLEELYFQKAETEATIEAWSTYREKFPEGKHKKDAEKAVQELRWAATLAENTTEAYKKFLEEFPKADKPRKKRAEGMVQVAEYGKLTTGEPKVYEVNMAEDPKGEKNGWGISAEITNGGDQELAYVNVTFEYLADDGSMLDRKDWPLVSPTWTMPVEEIATKPFKPGETRTWEWTVAKESVPPGWTQKVKVYPSGLKSVADMPAQPAE